MKTRLAEALDDAEEFVQAAKKKLPKMPKQRDLAMQALMEERRMRGQGFHKSLKNYDRNPKHKGRGMEGSTTKKSISDPGRFNIPGVHINDEARVYENARVFERAEVYNHARIYGNAQVFGKAEVSEYAQVYGNAVVKDDAMVGNYAKVYDDAIIKDDAIIRLEAEVLGDAVVGGKSYIGGTAKIYGGIWTDQRVMEGSWDAPGKPHI